MLSRKIFNLLTISLIALSTAQPGFAEKTDPSLLPPDVTLPVGNMSATTQTTSSQPGTSQPDTPAPGVGGGGGSPPQGLDGGSQPPPPGSGQNPGRLGRTRPAAVFPGGAPPAPAQEENRPDPIAIIETSKGPITIRLFRKLAPRTVAQFTELSAKGFYNGLTFHRVEKGFVVQGGCPNGNGSGLYMDGNKPKMLMLESNQALHHNAPGVVAMARFPKNPNSGSCQFYITLAPQPKLDGQYSIFGGVISGMEVVHQIAIGDKMNTVSVREQ